MKTKVSYNIITYVCTFCYRESYIQHINKVSHIKGSLRRQIIIRLGNIKWIIFNNIL